MDVVAVAVWVFAVGVIDQVIVAEVAVAIIEHKQISEENKTQDVTERKCDKKKDQT